MNGAARGGAHQPAQRERRPDKGDGGVTAAKRDQHIADRKPPAPDRVDHRMPRGGRRIDRRNRRVGAKVPREIERQLDAG